MTEHVCDRNRRLVAEALAVALGPAWTVRYLQSKERGMSSVEVTAPCGESGALTIYRDHERGHGWHDRTAANVAAKFLREEAEHLHALDGSTIYPPESTRLRRPTSPIDRMIDKACGLTDEDYQ